MNAGLLAVVERIHRFGPLRFDELMEVALYHPVVGFYPSGHGAGRGGDFLTSPEVGPLFGAVVARALDTWWRELGEPDPFLVVEAAAGVGTLARTIVAARPQCAPALHYVLVERAEALRALQGGRLHLEPARQVLGPFVHGDPEEGSHPTAHTGPVLAALDDLPAGRFTGVVLANELLDNLPVRLVERRADGWHEVRVGERDGSLVEILVPAEPDVADEADRMAPAAPEGSRIPLQHAAREWVRRALGLLEHGRLVLVDYAADTPSLAARPWRTWLRTYRAHGVGDDPLVDVGAQDITCDVAVDQLAVLRPPTLVRTQIEFLRAHGIEELVDEARAAWYERAGIGDLQAMKARSRVVESQALLDPDGLGAFRVLEWAL